MLNFGFFTLGSSPRQYAFYHSILDFSSIDTPTLVTEAVMLAIIIPYNLVFILHFYSTLYFLLNKQETSELLFANMPEICKVCAVSGWPSRKYRLLP